MSRWRRRKDPRVSVGGDVAYSALGPYSSVVVQQAPAPDAPAVEWPVEVGSVPALASAFQPRAGLRERIDAVRAEGGTAVLTQVLSGGGGVGKSQLAAAYAAGAVADGTDLVVWVPAGELQQVITLYARAAQRIAAPGAAGEDPEADARAFLAWLATTDRRWLVVLDDIGDPETVDGWWPSSRTGTGWVLATTRLHDARLTGGGRRRVSVDVYEPAEAVAYLRARLADEPALADGAEEELARELGHLPLALGHAAAYMLNSGLGCAAYLDLFRRSSLGDALPPSADAEGYGRAVATTLLLSLDAAEAADPAGLARPILRLAALLDPAGHPEALWETEAVLDHLDPLGDHEPEEIRASLRVLHRYALLACDSRAGTVRMHALTARAVRETTPEEEFAGLAEAAAEALQFLWPEPERPDWELAAVLRANTVSLAAAVGPLVWDVIDCRQLVFTAGFSLFREGRLGAATAYWDAVADACAAFLGAEHPDTLQALARLAEAYSRTGRVAEAIEVEEGVLAACERVLGPEDNDTLVTRADLATSYAIAGRLPEAVALMEQVVADRDRLFGPGGADTAQARANLAAYLQETGRLSEALVLAEQALVEMEEAVGPDHPALLGVRNNLAAAYHNAGRPVEAVALKERALADAERLLGAEHHQTSFLRGNLAVSYWDLGRRAEAVALLGRAVAELRSVLGPSHPDVVEYAGTLALMREAARSSRPLWRRLLGR
ncbi:tetratricopeptide repeat protein [Streptomyces sp. SKN60]|uniref:tetratricopeptide repeat protein n=1 Tax=Streptomyces sp. SKN60 TaxID=2855506 RepID=UPI0022466C35|nr:tetratricopeptide repeat protein [Streptomyces sp. SKN60]MCX2184917.1 tetratricopeptide repeat protein [Streptomyces sp. SKN60]